MSSIRETWQRLNRNAAEWVAALLGLFAVIAIAGASSRAEGLGAGLLFIGLLAGSFAAIVAHELGHALAAWAVGWRVWIVSALPVCLRLGFAPRLSAELRRDVGGYVLASPRTDAQDTRLRGVIVTAGGPLSSFAVGAALILWLMRFPAGYWEAPQNAGLLGSALAFSFYSLSAGLFSAWPVRMSDGRPNDGGMILAEIMAPRRAAGARALLGMVAVRARHRNERLAGLDARGRRERMCCTDTAGDGRLSRLRRSDRGRRYGRRPRARNGQRA